MKHIFRILLLLCISTGAFAQMITPLGSANSTVEAKGGLTVDSAFAVPWTSSFIGKGTDVNRRIEASRVDSLPTWMRRSARLKILTQWDSGRYYIPPSQKGQPLGVADLDVTGKVPLSELPSIVSSGQVYIDNSQAAMLAHGSATAGAFSVRTDSSNELFVLVTTPSSVRANWVQTTYTSAVLAFNLRTGVVVPRAGDYITDSVAEGVNNLYYTNARAQGQIAADTLTYLATKSSLGIDSVLAHGNKTKRTYFFGLDKNCDLGVQASTGSGELYLQDSTNTFNNRFFWVTKTGGYWMAEVNYDLNFTVMKAQHGRGYIEVHDSDGEIITEKFAGLRPDIRAQINTGPLTSASTTLAFPFQDTVKQVTINVPFKGVSGTQTWMLTALDTFGSPCATGYKLLTATNVGLNTVLTANPNTNQAINMGKVVSGYPTYRNVFMGLGSSDSSGLIRLLDTNGSATVVLSTDANNANVLSSSAAGISVLSSVNGISAQVSGHSIFLTNRNLNFFSTNGKYTHINDSAYFSVTPIKIGKLTSAARQFGSAFLGLSGGSDSSGRLVIQDTANVTTITGSTTNTSAIFTCASATNTSIVSSSTGLTSFHIIGNGTAPSIAAGAGAGTSPTISITGTDLAGYITITTGTSPSSGVTLATVTFATAYGAAPRSVILTTANKNAAGLTGATLPYIVQGNILTTAFPINIETALAASTTYQFFYQVIR